MKLQKVYIKNFRGIEELFIDFEGKTNLLIGENDRCKTTILEAVDLCFNSKLEKEDLHNLEFGSNNNAIVCCIFDENIKQNAGEGESFNAIVHKTHIEDEDEKISQSKYLFSFKLDITKDLLLEEINKDKKTLKDKEIKNPQELIYYMPAIDLDDPTKSSGDKTAFEKVFENLNNNEEIKEILKDYNDKARETTRKIFQNEENGISKILEEIFKIKGIDYEYSDGIGLKPSINIVRKYGDKSSKDLQNIGSGVKKIIKFIARLKFDGQQKSIFLIDEPEQNLHPSFQKLLIKFLKDEGIQCIFTSHSPTFVKHCMNNENCEVLICERDENGKNITVKSIKEHIEEKGYKFLENYTNSQAVANFLAFGEYSTDLHNLLYGLLDEKFKDGKITEELKNKLTEGDDYYWQRNDGKSDSPLCKYLAYFIRNKIHHPENHLNDNKTPAKEFDKYCEKSIDEMIEVLKNIKV